jgi:response regulator RpfG family c-di-GMP phosphodiesterase
MMTRSDRMDLKNDYLNLDFLIDDDDEILGGNDDEFYKVIIADDDDEVHKVTSMVLDSFEFEGAKLKLFNTFSAEETIELLKKESNIAVILLDVVMEEDHSGLEVVKYIREELKNDFIRIILRTGQPGKAPEEDIIVNYDINDYKSKTELTVQKLFTSLYSSLRAYRDLMIIENNKRGLEEVIKASGDLFKYRSFKNFVDGILFQLNSIFDFNKNSFFSRNEEIANEGFVSIKEDNKQIIVSSTGKFNDSIGKPIEEVLESTQLEKLSRARDNDVSFFDNCYIGYHKGVNDVENYIYMEANKKLDDIDQNLIKIFLNNFSVVFDNFQLNRDVINTQKEMIYTLGEVVENRSKSTLQHVRRVSEISYKLGIYKGMSEDEASLLKSASPMHDIGKIGIPDNILLKPGRLTEEEFEIMKTHTDIGHELLNKSKRDLLKMAAVVAYTHHERWDGLGYPNGLYREEIPLVGRITLIADIFDALTHERVYKKAWDIDEVLEYMKSQ